MDLLKQFTAFVQQHHLFQPKDKLMLAVSGGVDSVVLCELCHQAGYDLTILHCNFQLRGEESERDENFVRGLAEKYGVEVLVKKFDTEKYAAANKLSIQVAARELRYAWFTECLHKIRHDADGQDTRPGWLLTAHHANDNVETLLMNFFKGTGIGGLHGILPKKERTVRPLLFAGKQVLTEFAVVNNLDFVEDSSNASDKYTRNYFRNQLIPDLKSVFPQVEDNLLDNIERFREIELLYERSVQAEKKKLLEKKANEIHIPVLKLMKTEAMLTIIHEIIKDYGFTAHQVKEVAGLLKSGSGKYVSSATHRILRNRNWLIISPNETTEANTILIGQDDSTVKFQQGEITIGSFPITNHKPQTTNLIAQINAADIKFPLLLRKWKTGDYFYPLGMQKKKKKLSRFFIDQKLSLIQKEKTWVIETDKKIIWVVGLRIDDRFRITANTKEILQLTLIPAE